MGVAVGVELAEPPWLRVLVEGAPGPGVAAAFDASWAAMDEEGRLARWTSIMDVVEEDSYREWFTSVIAMQIAAH